MELTEPLDDIDLVLRHVSRQFPEALASALLPGATSIEGARWTDTQVSGRQRRLDRAIEASVGGEPRWIHVEWFLRIDADVAYRVYEYHVLFALALVDEGKLGQSSPRIDSVVVLLSGREEPWPEQGEYRTSPPEAAFSGVRFRIDPVYQRTVAELLARDNPLWLMFAPLTMDADERTLAAVVGALRERTTRRQFEEIAVAMVVLADADKRRRGLRAVVVSLLPEEIVMQNWLYKQGEQKGLEKGLEQGLEKGLEQGLEKGLEQGLEKGLEQGLEKGLEQGLEKGLERGLEKGLAPLAHLFERRLGRALSPSERAILIRRLDTLGPARLGDIVLDFAPDALVGWLAAPDAT